MKFEELNISKKIKKALEDIKYETLSPIQEQALPAVIDGRDVLGCAQTGTGKTCAFMVPVLNNILTSPPTRDINALILTPTRELAIQIYENTVAYAKYTNIKSLAIYGGVREGTQKIRLKSGINILIASPGRLLDFIKQNVVKLNKVNYLVLDEADRMLDMGFVKDVKRIVECIPKKRQTLLFSATMPKSIKELCDELLNDPINITITPPSTTGEKIDQSVYMVDKFSKTNLLIDLIKKENLFSVLVFTRAKYKADNICQALINAKISAKSIHGDKSQQARQQALKDFKKNKIQVLVATDIAARGIDIDYLSHVINFDLPEVSETYVHRIGRTARAGRSGVAMSFCSSEETHLLKQIEKDCKIDIAVVSDHGFPMKGKPSTSKTNNKNKKTVSNKPKLESKKKSNVLSKPSKKHGSNFKKKKLNSK